MPSTIADAMLQEFQQEVAITRKFLQRLPADKLDWRPHPKSMSAGQLALHLAELPEGVLRMAMQDEASPPDLSERPKPSSPQQILDALERSATFVRETLPQVDDRRMQATFKITQGGQTLMSLPRAAFLRSIMLNHWYQHRGQFGVYLRLLGASIPWSYGPSADESRPA
jgi:uncharacterized damage-inducible protein DinB